MKRRSHCWPRQLSAIGMGRPIRPDFCSVVLLAVVATVGFAEERPEIAFSDDAPTHIEYSKQRLALRMAEINLYPKHTKDPEAAREVAMKFLVRAAHWESDMPASLCPDRCRFRDIKSFAKQALSLGSKDPIVLRYHALFFLNHFPLRECSNRLSEAARIFDQSDYPRGLRFKYEAAIFRAQDIGVRVDTLRKTMVRVFDVLPAYLEWASRQPNSQRPSFQMIYDIARVRYTQLKSPAHQRLKDCIKSYQAEPYHDPWLAAMLKGMLHREIGWHARRINDDDAEGKDILDREQGKAAVHFRKAYQLRPEFPEAAGFMTYLIADGLQDSGTTWEWFKRAIAAEIDCSRAYIGVMTSRGVYRGGSAESRQAFAEKCRDLNRFDSKVPEKYIDWLVADGRYKELKFHPDIYRECQQCFRQYVDHPIWRSPDGSKQKGRQQVTYLARMIALATRADEFAEARELWEEMGNDMNTQEALSVFKKHGIRPEYDKSRIIAYEQFEDELFAIQPMVGERALGVEFSEEVNQAFQELLARDVPGARRYLETWEKITAMEVDYHNGDWLDMKFEKTIDPWIQTGRWDFVDENTVVLDNRVGDAGVYLRSLGHFPSPIEIQVEVENPERSNIYAGILRDGMKRSKSRWHIFGGRMKGGVASMNSWHTLGDGSYDAEPLRKLEVMSWGPERVEFRINNIPLPIYKLPGLSENESFVGLSSFLWKGNRGRLKFKNLRIRKIPYGIPPEEFEPRVAYYTNALERYPHRVDYYLRRGSTFSELDRWDEALKDLEKVRGKLGADQNHWIEYLMGNAYVNIGDKKTGISVLMNLYQSLPKKPTYAHKAFGYGAACDVIDALISSDVSSQQEITRAKNLASELVRKLDDCKSHIALAKVQVKEKQWSAAKKSLARAKTKKPDKAQAERISALQEKIMDAEE